MHLQHNVIATLPLYVKIGKRIIFKILVSSYKCIFTSSKIIASQVELVYDILMLALFEDTESRVFGSYYNE